MVFQQFNLFPHITVLENCTLALRLMRGMSRAGAEFGLSLAIRAFFAEITATGRKFELGKQSPAIINGDLALTSTRLPDGSVTAEVARRQADGRWLWVIDKFSIA